MLDFQTFDLMGFWVVCILKNGVMRGLEDLVAFFDPPLPFEKRRGARREDGRTGVTRAMENSYSHLNC